MLCKPHLFYVFGGSTRRIYKWARLSE